MSKVFISHKWEEKNFAKSLQSYLESCLLSTWLDERDLHSGNLTNEVLNAIDTSECLVAMISERYLDSKICLLEFERAFQKKISGNYRIVITTLGDRRMLIEKAKNKCLNQIAHLLENDICIPFNQYDLTVSNAAITKAIVAHYPIYFTPIKRQSVAGQDLQIIEINALNVPTDVFKNLNLEIEDFISLSDDDAKPIKRGIPVALFGRTAAWIYAHIAMSFYNKRDVFIYNNTTDDFICIYSLTANKDKYTGLVLKSKT